MKLKCKAKCTKVNKKSSSPAFKDLCIGDVIELSIDVAAVGSGSKGSKAAYICCVNPKTKLQSKLSFNQIERVLEAFEFEEIQ